jgi:hypothetical protein
MSNRVCIIGAGSSGLVAAKIFHQRGIPFDCYDLSSGIGGLWRYNNDNEMSSAYRSLHINSSRHEMAFSDYPMPSEFPDFPHHSQILRYFENYVDHFNIREKITFRTRVEKVQPTYPGYRVTVSDRHGQRTMDYGSVIVANGHHWCPRHVEFPGDFHGKALHSHYYKTPEELVDKRVLVIGIGNSGCDIACESSRVSKKTILSTRRGAHIIPKYIFGKPLDRVCPPFIWNWLPLVVFQRLFGFALYLTRGRLSRYGLPKPAHRILEEHPTVSSDLLNLIGHGRVHVKPNVKEFAGDVVRFADGSEETVDVVIHATGYQIKFPFLDVDIMSPEANEVRLFRRVVHPTMPGLYFVGLVQPWGPLMPLSEAQSEWIADLVEGTATLPTVDEMERAIDRERQKMRRRYTDSVRHTIQVDFHPYLAELKHARKVGRKRTLQLKTSAENTDISMEADQQSRKAA